MVFSCSMVLPSSRLHARPFLSFRATNSLTTCYAHNFAAFQYSTGIYAGIQICNLQRALKVEAISEESEIGDTATLLTEDEEQKKIPSIDVEDSVRVLKNAAKTRKVPSRDILNALSVLEKAKIEPSGYFQALGGSDSPGRTWMLIFTAEKKLKGGRYFPITAVQRFDAIEKRIENGVFLGPIGSLTFEGRLKWNNRILAFIFERVRLTLGPLKTLEFSLGKEEEREPTTKDPFFIWFYVDEEIAVARGRSGGTAFWCRCERVAS